MLSCKLLQISSYSTCVWLQQILSDNKGGVTNPKSSLLLTLFCLKYGFESVEIIDLEGDSFLPTPSPPGSYPVVCVESNSVI
jgi:hypothetical protein